MQNVLNEARQAERAGDRSRAAALLTDIAWQIAERLGIEFDVAVAADTVRSDTLIRIADKIERRENWITAKNSWRWKNDDGNLAAVSYLRAAGNFMQRQSGAVTDTDVHTLLMQTERYLPTFLSRFPDARIFGRVMEDVTAELDGRRIALRAEHNGRYVYADEDVGTDFRGHSVTPLFCKTEKADAWETFRVRVLPDGWAALQSYNGRWVLDAASAGTIARGRSNAESEFLRDQYLGFISEDEEFVWNDRRSYLWCDADEPVFPDAAYGTREKDYVKLRFYRLDGVYYLRTLDYSSADPSHPLYPSPTGGFWVSVRFDMADDWGRISVRSCGDVPDAWETFLLEIL